MQKSIFSKKITLLFLSAVATLLLGRYFQLSFLLFLFPVFAIRYLRNQELLKGFLLLFAGSLTAILISFWGIAAHMFSSNAVFVVVMAVSTLIGLMPILLDAWLFKKGFNQLWLISIYPFSKIFLEYIGSANSPFGIWGSQASLLAGWEPLNNIVAYGGIWALSLLVSFFSSILVYLLQNRPNNNKSKSLMLSYGLVVAVIAIWGAKDIKKYNPQEKVKVAVVLANDSLRTEPVNRIYHHLLNQKIQTVSATDSMYYHNAFELSNTELLNQAVKAADSGAKIIFCAEGNVVLMKNDEQAFIESVKKIAKEKLVYIGIAAEVFSADQPKPVENKIIFIRPDGSIGFEYFKHYPIGIEKDLMVVGDGNIPVCNTEYGKISAVICFDTDFITYARKAGSLSPDILFAPSNDWEAIAVLRGKITRYRALENGFTLVRPTSHGVTEMVAPNGKLIFANNYFQNPTRVLLADVPSKNKTTAYIKWGDWLPKLAAIMLVILLVTYFIKSKRKMSNNNTLLFCMAILFCLPVMSMAQNNNSIDTTKKGPTSRIKKSKTVLFPAISYAPETNLALGVSAMHFYKQSGNATLSNISCNLLYTFNKQFINELNVVHYTSNNNYLFKAAFAFNKFPENFYGIGNKTEEQNQVTISYNAVKADISTLKKIHTNTYFGLYYSYANYYNIYADNTNSNLLDTLNGGKNNIKSGLGFEVLYDSRDNINNSSKGYYASLKTSWMNKALGSSTNYFSVDADVRKYRQLKSGAILALQGVAKIKEGEVPFTQLSYLGGNNIMRGFYAGRFRDNDLIAFQAEYRRHLWRQWGFVLFAGTGKVGSSIEEINTKELQHSLGFGFRRTISKQQKLNLRIDVGYGNGQCNFYVNIGEAF
ncbi:MAG: BamA/TamA family outer membrane protein [Flectobacillus sp.]|uniref:BamA/TamA family outer membrane protein n=1 Tax=Flectobacillus sp. TaxID=50419 RepID=UPI003B9CB260